MERNLTLINSLKALRYKCVLRRDLKDATETANLICSVVYSVHSRDSRVLVARQDSGIASRPFPTIPVMDGWDNKALAFW